MIGSKRRAKHCSIADFKPCQPFRIFHRITSNRRQRESRLRTAGISPAQLYGERRSKTCERQEFGRSADKASLDSRKTAAIRRLPQIALTVLQFPDPYLRALIISVAFGRTHIDNNAIVPDNPGINESVFRRTD